MKTIPSFVFKFIYNGNFIFCAWWAVEDLFETLLVHLLTSTDGMQYIKK